MGPACGGALRVELAGPPRTDSAAGSIQLGFLLRSTGATPVRGPARLYAWPDSTVFGAGTGGSVPFPLDLVADSLQSDPTIPEAVSLRVRGIGEARDGGTVGDTAWLTARLPRHGRRMRLPVHARARLSAAPVPPVPTPFVPDAFRGRRNEIRSDYYTVISDRIVRNALDVGFAPEIPLDARQDAIDAVWGRVVGGFQDVPRDTYLVWVPDDGTGRQIVNASRFLRRFPGVNAVPIATNVKLE